jgi:hypothetical protein
MRGLQRAANRVVGIFLFLFVVTFAFSLIPKYYNRSVEGSVARNTVTKPVLVPAVVNKNISVPVTAAAGSVLGNNGAFWIHIDMGCAGGTTQGNHCTLPSGALKLTKVSMSKEHWGLQIYDDVGVSGTVNKKGNGSCPAEYKRDPFTCTESKDKKTGLIKYSAKATFKYCKQTEKYESLAELNLSPLSYPTVFMGQDISSRRYSGTEESGENVFYVKIDRDALVGMTSSKLKNFCSRVKKAASGRYYQDIFYDMEIYNSVGLSLNQGTPVSNALTTLCLYTPSNQMDAVIAEILKPETYKTIAVRIGVENNALCCGDVQEPFKSTGYKSLKYLVHGFIPPPGSIYSNNWSYQPKQALYAQVQGQTGATKLISSLYLPPGKTIDDTAFKPTSVDIMSVEATTYQMESAPETIRNAIFGGVYIMDKSVITDSENLSLLSWDPKSLNTSQYLCDNFPDRCPIVRAISGCISTSAAQTDIRLRQIAVALNDTEKYAGVTDSDKIPRNSIRGDSMVTLMQNAPIPLIDNADINEIIVASGKGTPACMAYAQKKIDEIPEADKYTSEQMAELTKEIESGRYIDMAVLVTPVKVKYKGWALYDIDVDIYNKCRSYGGCGNEDPLSGGKTGLYNIKYTEGEKTRGALLSFNVAVYMRGLDNYVPSSVQLQNWRYDLKQNLADSKIYELEEARIECDPAGYWICSGASRELLPPCQP